MFRIVVLLEPIVTIWECTLRERQQHIFQYLPDVKFFLHDSRKDEDWSSTPL